MTVPLYNLTDTWNDSGTVFTAIQMNVTNTASASGSKLLDLQVGGTTAFSVQNPSGHVYIITHGSAGPTFDFQSSGSVFLGPAGTSDSTRVGYQGFSFDSWTMGSNFALAWTSANVNAAGGTRDVLLW